MNIFNKLRSVRYGFGIKSNVGKYSKIIKEKNSNFVHGNVQIREQFMLIIRKESSMFIGNNLFCNKNVNITCQKNIHIGDNVIIGPNVVIVDHNHDYKAENMAKSFVAKDVYIGNNVWIGANVTILPGAYIDDGAVIGANSVVNKVVGKDEIWGGNPAKFIKNRR